MNMNINKYDSVPHGLINDFARLSDDQIYRQLAIFKSLDTGIKIVVTFYNDFVEAQVIYHIDVQYNMQLPICNVRLRQNITLQCSCAKIKLSCMCTNPVNVTK